MARKKQVCPDDRPAFLYLLIGIYCFSLKNHNHIFIFATCSSTSTYLKKH